MKHSDLFQRKHTHSVLVNEGLLFDAEFFLTNQTSSTTFAATRTRKFHCKNQNKQHFFTTRWLFSSVEVSSKIDNCDMSNASAGVLLETENGCNLSLLNIYSMKKDQNYKDVSLRFFYFMFILTIHK